MEIDFKNEKTYDIKFSDEPFKGFDFLHSLKIKDGKLYLDDFEIKGIRDINISQKAPDIHQDYPSYLRLF